MICDSELLNPLADNASAQQMSPLKTHARGFSQKVLGQTAWYRARSGANATGSADFTYKLASGRGEFLQTDPLRFGAGDYNLYRYVFNNPINLIDLFGYDPGDPYPTRDEAGTAAVEDINPTSIKEGKECSGWVYKNKDGTYSYTKPQQGTKDESASSPNPKPPSGTAQDGGYHTHGDDDPEYGSGNETFSPEDKEVTDKRGTPEYLGTPSGKVKRYDPDPEKKGEGEVTEIKKKKKPKDC